MAKRTLKIGTKVNVLRSELAPTLAATLPSFIFFNTGKIVNKELSGTRLLVKWNKEDLFWFDACAIEEQGK